MFLGIEGGMRKDWIWEGWDQWQQHPTNPVPRSNNPIWAAQACANKIAGVNNPIGQVCYPKMTSSSLLSSIEYSQILKLPCSSSGLEFFCQSSKSHGGKRSE